MPGMRQRRSCGRLAAPDRFQSPGDGFDAGYNPIQDWFAMDDSIKRKDYEAEHQRPSGQTVWRYRMHITLEEAVEGRLPE